MFPSRKLRTAHFLMFIGLVPMMFAVAMTIAAIAFTRGHPGQGAGSDAFLLIALSLLGYFTNLILGGIGALWSWFLTSRHIDQRTTATLVLRILVVIALIVPLFWYLTLAF